MFNVFMWVVSGFTFCLYQGKRIYSVSKKIVSLPFYRAESARRRFLFAGGSLGLTAWFAEDTYDAIAHMVVDDKSDLTFRDALAAYIHGDLSLAQAGSNYMTGYGSAMLIFIGVSTIELIPVSRMLNLGIKNPTTLLHNKGIRNSIMSKFKHVDFKTMQTILASTKWKPGMFKNTKVNMSMSKQRDLYDAIHTYFGKLKAQSKIKSPKTKNKKEEKPKSESFKRIVAKMSDNKGKVGGTAGATTAMFSLFIYLWLVENDSDGDETTAINDTTRMYKLCSTMYNRFYQNPIMSGDIRSYSTVHKIKSTTGYGSFIELHMLGRKVIETWYALRDDGKPLFAKYLEVILVDIIKVLDGNLQNVGIVPQIVRLLLAAIDSGNVEQFLKLITLGITEDDKGQNKVYTGVARNGISVKRLLGGFGSTHDINSLLNEKKSTDNKRETAINKTPSVSNEHASDIDNIVEIAEVIQPKFVDKQDRIIISDEMRDVLLFNSTNQAAS